MYRVYLFQTIFNKRGLLARKMTTYTTYNKYKNKQMFHITALIKMGQKSFLLYLQDLLELLCSLIGSWGQVLNSGFKVKCLPLQSTFSLLYKISTTIELYKYHKQYLRKSHTTKLSHIHLFPEQSYGATTGCQERIT